MTLNVGEDSDDAEVIRQTVETVLDRLHELRSFRSSFG
jgi:hypothetical protein